VLEAAVPNSIRDISDEVIANTRTWNRKEPVVPVVWPDTSVITIVMYPDCADGKQSSIENVLIVLAVRRQTQRIPQYSHRLTTSTVATWIH
jgi:hypothetical protein